MKTISSLLSIASLLSFFSHTACGNPWFTGPLLAPAGHTIPKGHSNLELYGFYTINEGIYSRTWKLIRTPNNTNIIFNPLFTHGLSDHVDVQFSFPYIENTNQDQRGSGISDNFALIGFQLLEQKNHQWLPDLRFTIQEIFPTGRYNRLSPTRNGTDATGVGSYRTVFTSNFQYLMPVFQTHFLRTRLSISYVNASKVNLNGLSSYGGSANTLGRIRPGNVASIDLAGEFTLTKHWVAVMEGYHVHRQATHFQGFNGTTANGMSAKVGHGVATDTSIAPAIEYNVNGHIGIIAGPWLSIDGNNDVKFLSYVIALNAYW